MKTRLDNLRLCIHAKEIVLITGFSEGYARRIIRSVKKKLQKESHQPVTIKELCEYLGLDEHEVRDRLF